MIDDRGYPKDWRKYPSVTGILPKPDFHCSPEYLERARVQGTNNHLRVKRYLETGNNRGVRYLELFEDFLRDTSKRFGKIIMSEIPLLSKKYEYKGTPDIVFENAIVDLKRTFSDAKHHALQLAGYNMLTKENRILRKTKNRFILVIGIDDDKYNIWNVYNDRADDIFMVLLQMKKMEQTVNAYYEQNII